MPYNNGTKNNKYKKNGNNNHDQAPRRPKKETFAFKLLSTYTVNDRQNGTVEVDKESVYSKLNFLQENGIFDVLTQNVTIANEVLREDGKKGNSIIGFIESVDTANETANVTIYGNSVERMRVLMEQYDFILEPRIIAYNGEFKCFNGFNLVKE